RNEMISAVERHKLLMRRNDLFEILLGRLAWRDVIRIALEEEHGYRKFEPERSQVALKHRAVAPAQILRGERHPFAPVVPVQQREIRHEGRRDRTGQLEIINGWQRQ